MSSKLLELRKNGRLFLSKQKIFSRSGQDSRGPSHSLYEHTPLWEYVSPSTATPYPDKSTVLFASVPKGTKMARLLGMTRLFVFIGAAQSKEFLTARQFGDAVLLIFEPGHGRFNTYARQQPEEEGDAFTLYFVGETGGFDRPLSELVSKRIFEMGFPVIFVQEGVEQEYPEYVQHVTEEIELLYYREKIYPVEGQFLFKSIPIRPMARHLFFDPQKHFYENFAHYPSSRVIEDIAGAYEGVPAICIAAGPELDNQLEYIRQYKDKALLVCVNNALKPLLAAGIEPHFVVINDGSVHVEDSFRGIPPLKNTALVCHCYSTTGDGVFPLIFFFGDPLHGQTRLRQDLERHGSVITTAYSLAAHLGCSEAILAGVSLSSPNPYGMSYSATSIHGRTTSPTTEQPLIHKYPQLYPVKSYNGKQLYTTLNFYDASRWFLEHIRKTGLKVVNITSSSILFSPDVPVIENYPIQGRPPQVPHSATMSFGLPPEAAVEAALILANIKNITAEWERVKNLAINAIRIRNLETHEKLVQLFDNNQISYLVERFENFDNKRFHEGFFDSTSEQARLTAAEYYMEHIVRMAELFLNTLAASERKLYLLLGKISAMPK